MKRLLFLLMLPSLLCAQVRITGPGGYQSTSAPVTHTFTFVQGKNSAFNCTVGSATCTFSGFTACGAGHDIKLGVYYGNSTPILISSVSGCGTTWQLNVGTSACQVSGTSTAAAHIGSSSTGSSITVTMASAPTSRLVIFMEEDSYTPNDGGATLDSATSVATSTAASPLPGVAPVITGTSDAVWQFVASAGASPTAISAGYGNTVFQGDFASADLLNTTSTTQPTWTVSANSQGCAVQVSVK
jgi:hypothetical protein